MSTALQVALFLASLAVIVFVMFFIPVCIMMYLQILRVIRQVEELKSEVRALVRDSQATLQNINHLTHRAHMQMEELEKVVRTVGAWSDRANRIVEEIGDVIEAPILTAARFITALHKTLSSLWESPPQENRPLKSVDAHAKE